MRNGKCYTISETIGIIFTHDQSHKWSRFRLSFTYLPWSRSVNVCNEIRTCFNLSLAASSTRLPSASNFWGGWNALRVNSGLLMKWRSRNTPICRRWYCDLPPPKPPPVLITAAGLSAQTLGALEAQSRAFLSGAGIVTSKVNQQTRWSSQHIGRVFESYVFNIVETWY